MRKISLLEKSHIPKETESRPGWIQASTNTPGPSLRSGSPPFQSGSIYYHSTSWSNLATEHFLVLMRSAEKKSQFQSQNRHQSPQLHPTLPPGLLPLYDSPSSPATSSSPSQRASEELRASDLSPAPIEKWVLVTTQITAFQALLPTARWKGPPKGGTPLGSRRVPGKQESYKTGRPG